MNESRTDLGQLRKFYFHYFALVLAVKLYINFVSATCFCLELSSVQVKEDVEGMPTMDTMESVKEEAGRKADDNSFEYCSAGN